MIVLKIISAWEVGAEGPLCKFFHSNLNFIFNSKSGIYGFDLISSVLEGECLKV
jgi:hypothetical protein